MTTFEREQEGLSLRQSLETLRADELRRLASTFERPGTRRKAELVGLILGHLDGSRLRSQLERLSDLEIAAVAEAVHSSEPVFRAVAFQARYGSLPAWKPLWQYGRSEEMSLLWLFFQGDPPRVADELRDRLRPIVPKPPPFALPTVDELPSHLERTTETWTPSSRRPKRQVERAPIVARESEPIAHHDLRAVLTLVDEGRARIHLDVTTLNVGRPGLRHVSSLGWPPDRGSRGAP